MLIEEASAQTAEAIKAGSEAGNVLLTQGGVLGAVCVLLALALAALFVVLLKRFKRYEDLIERAITGLEAAADAASGTDRALTELRRAIDGDSKTTGDLGGQISVLAEKVQHGFGNTSGAMQAVARELERIRDRRDLLVAPDRGDLGRS